MKPKTRRFPLESLQAAQTAPGVTLIELLVVTFLIGLVFVVAIPMASSQSGFQLDGAARRIMADIRYTQSQALHKGKPQALIFDPSLGLYYYPTDSDPDQAEIEPISKKDYRILFSQACADEDLLALSHAVEFPTIALAAASFGGDSVLYFDWLGLPVAADGTLLAGADIEISCGELSRTITVETTTGRVTIN